jgi:hypothetical protein
MKLPAFVFLIIALCQPMLHAQTPAPGSIEMPILWGKTEQQATGITFCTLVENSTNLLQFDKRAAGTFNYNPALLFGEIQPELRFPFGGNDLSKMTVFTVFHATDTVIEKSVWHFEKNGTPELLLTTHRMADIGQVRFMNFPDERKDFPILNTYSQFKQADTTATGGQVLVLGKNPAMTGIPIVPFMGSLAEIIVYDKVLSPLEQQKVESYLAIKYGIPLSPNSSGTYLNSQGETLRDGKKFRAFSNRVAGIGRDDISGLCQKQSASSYDPELLTIGAGQLSKTNASNPAILENNTFLLWGDNNAAFALGEKEQGKPHFISRKWMMTTFGETQNVETEMRFDVRRLGIELKKGESWWLAVDGSGSGTFPVEHVEYFPVNEITPAGIAVFKNAHWDSDRSGSDLFTIGTAPEMMPKFWITAPLCFPETTGKIDIGAEGGKPPYAFELRALEHTYRKTWSATNNGLSQVNGILPGEYVLSVADAAGRLVHDTVFVQSADAPVSKLASSFWLNLGETLTLDAGKDMPDADYQFRWSGPGGFSENTARIRVASPGTYVLNISLNGCESRQKIEVKQVPDSNFRKVELYPNPAPGGNFQLAVYLHEPAPVAVRISDATGKAVFTQNWLGSEYYKNGIRLGSPPGMYFVTVTSEKATQTFKLIIP